MKKLMTMAVTILLLSSCAAKESIVNEYLLSELIQTRGIVGQYQQALAGCQQQLPKKAEGKKK